MSGYPQRTAVQTLAGWSQGQQSRWSLTQPRAIGDGIRYDESFPRLPKTATIDLANRLTAIG